MFQMLELFYSSFGGRGHHSFADYYNSLVIGTSTCTYKTLVHAVDIKQDESFATFHTFTNTPRKYLLGFVSSAKLNQ